MWNPASMRLQSQISKCIICVTYFLPSSDFVYSSLYALFPQFPYLTSPKWLIKRLAPTGSTCYIFTTRKTFLHSYIHRRKLELPVGTLRAVGVTITTPLGVYTGVHMFLRTPYGIKIYHNLCSVFVFHVYMNIQRRPATMPDVELWIQVSWILNFVGKCCVMHMYYIMSIQHSSLQVAPKITTRE